MFHTALSLLAPTFALVHVVIQTGTVSSDVPGKLAAAAWQFQSQPDGFHHIVSHASSTVGTEVFRTVIRQLADQFQFRINILHIQTDIGIAFVVFQQNVVFGTVALDQGAFQH